MAAPNRAYPKHVCAGGAGIGARAACRRWIFECIDRFSARRIPFARTASPGGVNAMTQGQAEALEERGRRPILRNKKKASERHRCGNQGAPANLRAIVLSEDRAENPSHPENEHSNQIRIVIVRQGDRRQKSSRKFKSVLSLRKDETYSLNLLLGVACFSFCSSRMSARESYEPRSQCAKKSPRAIMT